MIKKMEATLFIKDTLDVQVLSNLTTASNITSSCNCNIGGATFCYESVCITGIICLTIFVVIFSTIFMILWYKKELGKQIQEEKDRKYEEDEALRKFQQAIEIEKEKARYRERLANFIDLQAKGITKNKDEVYAFNDEISTYYVEELKSYIRGLAPTETPYIFSKKNNSTESPND